MKAKEMFEKLGFDRKTKQGFIIYTKSNKYIKIGIVFCKEQQEIEYENLSKLYFVRIDKEENNAIQKQIQELGWLSEVKDNV